MGQERCREKNLGVEKQLTFIPTAVLTQEFEMFY
jgi:hypothetical protein